MAIIKISIDEGLQRIFHWESKDMETFTAAILIRAMSSAIDKTVKEAVIDSAVARCVEEENIAMGIKKAKISRATLYRGMDRATAKGKKGKR